VSHCRREVGSADAEKLLRGSKTQKKTKKNKKKQTTHKKKKNKKKNTKHHPKTKTKKRAYQLAAKVRSPRTPPLNIS
jgi:hypothetical protein